MTVSDNQDNGASAAEENWNWRSAGSAYPGVYVSRFTVDEALTPDEREQAYQDFMKEYEDLLKKRAQRR
jgi:hypothetical protein